MLLPFGSKPNLLSVKLVGVMEKLVSWVWKLKSCGAKVTWAKYTSSRLSSW